MRRLHSIPGTQVLAALPVLPLPNVVLLPGMMLPLNVHEPRYLELVDFVRQTGQHIGIPLLRPPGAEDSIPPLAALGPLGPLGPLEQVDPVEPVMGVGRLVFHVALPDGRRIIRLEGVGRVRIQREQPGKRVFRELAVTPLGEPLPADASQMLALKSHVERIAGFCGDDSESLLSLLALRDDRVFLYSLTAFLPSLELLACDLRQWVHDEHLLVYLQQRSLAAEDADARARFLLERTTTILDRLGETKLQTAGALYN
ncbi:MAG: LON peptidase substrate-binding domain-containing protein [Nannocystis sp.]|nr:LON peptidase substrate-binding domain-containing protein [Nannocystis sp.]MBA3548010.1 LON peptidase substrate-binding domain-containing protein [Nannocystis sp.]